MAGRIVLLTLSASGEVMSPFLASLRFRFPAWYSERACFDADGKPSWLRLRDAVVRARLHPGLPRHCA